MRFQQLFGDTKTFGLSIGFCDDPAPPRGIEPSVLRSWGTLEIWLDGICLTQHTQPDGSGGTAIAWYLLPLLEWLDGNAIELLNREPFAYPIRREEGGTALAWLDSASEGLPAKATDWNEEEWFNERYSFWKSHALRAAMPGAACPHVVFHRVGDDIEVAWDNEGAPPPRPGLQYAHSRGARLVNGLQVAEALRSAVRGACAWLSKNGVLTNLRGHLANGQGPDADAWQCLLPRRTAELASQHEKLREEMASAIPVSGAFVPHTLASSLLRAIEVKDAKVLDDVAAFASRPPPASADAVWALRAMTPAPRWDAWRSGYVAAQAVRERLGWGVGPVPDLRAKLGGLGVEVSDTALPSGVACAAIAFRSGPPRLVIGGTGQMSPAMRLATGFGHLLLDSPPERDFGVVSSAWMDAPTVARAKAFGAMLLMPEERCREIAKQVADPGTLVQRVMQTFTTTRRVTAWHLYHLRLIDEDDVEAIFG